MQADDTVFCLQWFSSNAGKNCAKTTNREEWCSLQNTVCVYMCTCGLVSVQCLYIEESNILDKTSGTQSCYEGLNSLFFARR